MTEDVGMEIDFELEEKEEKKNEKKINVELCEPEKPLTKRCVNMDCMAVMKIEDLKCEKCGYKELEAGKAYDLSLKEKKIEEEEEIKNEKEEIKIGQSDYLPELRFKPVPVPADSTVHISLEKHTEILSKVKPEKMDSTNFSWAWADPASSPFYQPCPGMGDPIAVNTWIANCLPLREDQKRELLVDLLVEEMEKKGHPNDDITKGVIRDILRQAEVEWDPLATSKPSSLHNMDEKIKEARKSIKDKDKSPEELKEKRLVQKIQKVIDVRRKELAKRKSRRVLKRYDKNLLPVTDSSGHKH